MRFRFHTRRERHLWTAAGAVLATIYASLYWMPPLVDYLGDRGILLPAVAAAFAAVALAVALALARTRPGWREMAAVGLFVPAYGVLLARMKIVQEALHFLEYGLVGGLIYAALEERRRSAAPVATAPGRRGGTAAPARRRAAPLLTALAAAALTTAAGWLDEGIQFLLPNRYYDLRDVVFNAAAGAVAITAVALRGWARRRDRAARPAL